MTFTTSLPDQMSGRVIVPGDDEYEDARHVYNFMIDKHSSVIARCASTHDVQAVVAHARDSGRDLAVRGGGHSVPGFGTADDAIVADLSPMTRIEVDPERRTARVGGGSPGGC
jgi:FAD/FMN-containing dehydrogenase